MSERSIEVADELEKTLLDATTDPAEGLDALCRVLGVTVAAAATSADHLVELMVQVTSITTTYAKHVFGAMKDEDGALNENVKRMHGEEER